MYERECHLILEVDKWHILAEEKKFLSCLGEESIAIVGEDI